MLALKIGRFNPELEGAMLDEIRDLKRADPFCHVAVVVPSGWLRKHILRLIASALGPTAGVHFLTLFGLAGRVVVGGSSSCRQGISENLRGGVAAPPFVLERLVGRIIRKNSNLLPWLRNVRDFPGAARATLRAIEDLRDAGVSPEMLKDAAMEFDEKDVGAENLRRLRELNLVYSEYSSQIVAGGIIDLSACFQAAAQAAPSSACLRLFKRIIFYGFYDLTTVQYDFVEAVFKDYETSFFMPFELQSGAGQNRDKPAHSTSSGHAMRLPRGEGAVAVPVAKETARSPLGRLGAGCSRLGSSNGEPQPAACNPQSVASGSQSVAYAFAAELFAQLRGHTRQGRFTNLSGQAAASESHAQVGPLAGSFSGEVMRLFSKGGLRLVSAAGAHDEVWFAAKEILALVELEHYAFEDIAVIARTLEPYAAIVDSVFRANCIPYVTSAEEPVCRHPLAKAIMQLASLVTEDFYRSTVIDLLSSSYVNRDKLCGAASGARVDVWDALTRKLAIAQGVQEWKQRLGKFIERKGILGLEGDEEGVGIPHDIALNQAALLLKAVEGLETMLNALPNCAGYASHCEALRTFILELVKLPEPTSVREKAVLKTVLDGLEELALLDASGGEIPRAGQDTVPPGGATSGEPRGETAFHPASGTPPRDEEVSRAEFVKDFTDLMRRARLPLGLETGRGVRVLDAMTARGANFRAVFLLGTNAKVFPRIVREEPFLRDSVRSRLSETIGVRIPQRKNLASTIGARIPQKLRGIEEEMLLFQLVLNSARDVLHIVYQRSNEKGAAQVRSLYLEAVREALLGGAADHREPASARELAHEDVKIPRGLRGKLEKRNPILLTPMEAQIRELLLGHDAGRCMKALSKDLEGFKRARQALKCIEEYGPLCEFDGIDVRLAEWWKNAVARGFSPTSLEKWRECPFAYMIERVMGLEPLEEPEEAEAAETLLVGRLYHDILKDFYGSLKDSGYFSQAGAKADPIALLRRIAAENFRKFEESAAVGYPLLWESQKKKILETLATFVPADLQRITNEDVTPAEFELQGDCQVEIGAREALRFHGRIDRLDVNAGTGKFIVSDYKSNRRELKSDLRTLALKCEKLQAPLYFLMAENFLKMRLKPDRASSEARFLFVKALPETGFESGKQLSGKFWDDEKAEFAERLAVLTDSIRRGFFPISPSEERAHFCRDRCAFKTVCRWSHPPSRFRAENSPKVEEVLGKFEHSRRQEEKQDPSSKIV